MKNHKFDILIDNDIKNVEEAKTVGVTPILFGPFNPNYSGYQTDNWNEVPSIIEKILEDRKRKNN